MLLTWLHNRLFTIALVIKGSVEGGRHLLLHHLEPYRQIQALPEAG